MKVKSDNSKPKSKSKGNAFSINWIDPKRSKHHRNTSSGVTYR